MSNTLTYAKRIQHGGGEGECGGEACVCVREKRVNIFFLQHDRHLFEMNIFHLTIPVNSMSAVFWYIYSLFFCAALNGWIQKDAVTQGAKPRRPQGGSDEPKMIPKERAHENEPFRQITARANGQACETCTSVSCVHAGLRVDASSSQTNRQ